MVGNAAASVPLNDAAALADALGAALANPERTSQQGRAARTHVEEHSIVYSALGKNLVHALSRYQWRRLLLSLYT